MECAKRTIMAWQVPYRHMIQTKQFWSKCSQQFVWLSETPKPRCQCAQFFVLLGRKRVIRAFASRCSGENDCIPTLKGVQRQGTCKERDCSLLIIQRSQKNSIPRNFLFDPLCDLYFIRIICIIDGRQSTKIQKIIAKCHHTART